MSNETTIPAVFVHGLLGMGEDDKVDSMIHYWGSKEADLIGHLRSEGRTVYNPSLGPVNGAWDRCCILYAMLKGGRVDYGKVHSEKYGHARYGKTYPGLIPDWGEDGPNRRIHIFGHSFGGPTILEFAELLRAGSEEERTATPPDELNPLFEGGKGDWLKTVTTLSGVNNGTTYASLIPEKGMRLFSEAALFLIAAIGNTRLTKFYDMHMQQWGIMKDPDDIHLGYVRIPLSSVKAIHRFGQNTLDHIGFELTVDVMHDLNETRGVDPKVYYFARIGRRSKDDGHGHQVPTKNMCKEMKMSSYLTGFHIPKRLKQKFGLGKEWLPNDGIVNCIGQSAPLNLPHEDATDIASCKPGKWYNMPVEDKDHMSWCGWGMTPEEFYEFYDNLLAQYDALP